MKTAKIGMILIVGLVATPVVASLVTEAAPDAVVAESPSTEFSGFDLFGITDRAYRTRLGERQLWPGTDSGTAEGSLGSSTGLVSGLVERAQRTRVVERTHL